MTPLNASSLVRSLRENQLLDTKQLEEISRSPLAANPDPKPLATALVQQGWLTPFQINQLLQGRGKELVLGPFRLLDRLGESSLGKVFKAFYMPVNRLVAVQVIPKEKFPSPDAAARFYGQVQAIQQINHPHLLFTFGVIPLPDAHAVVLEIPDGSDLGQHVQRTGPLPVALACKYIQQAAVGLQVIHERGAVHRCIRPASLFLAQIPGTPNAGATNAGGGTIKLLDLGLGGLVQPSPEYLAPEQANNPTGCDIRSDLYSLGCTFYFLLAGRPPFQSNSVAQLLQKRQNEAPPSVTQFRGDVSPAVVAIIDRLLAKRPQDRFQSPAELVSALGAATRQPGITANRPLVVDTSTPPQPAVSPPLGQQPLWLGTAAPISEDSAKLNLGTRRRGPLVIAAIVGLCLVGGALAVVSLVGNPFAQQTYFGASTTEIAELPLAVPPTHPSPKTELRPLTDSKVDPKGEPVSKTDPIPKIDPKPEPTPQADPKPEPKVEPKNDVASLMMQLKEKDEFVRLKAARMLEKLGPPARSSSEYCCISITYQVCEGSLYIKTWIAVDCIW